MEGWDLEKVKELAAQYNAAGLGSTSTGVFLNSLATEGRPPRGGGIPWLQSIIAKGDPGRFKGLLQEVEELQRNCPTLQLVSIMRSLGRGDPLADWQLTRVEEARKLSQEPLIELTAEEIHIVKNLQCIISSRSSFYWASRPAIYQRIRAICEQIEKCVQIRRSDLDYLFEQFGPAVREMRSPKFKVGDLVGHVGGDAGLVTSEPYVDGSSIYYNVLISGKEQPILGSSLRKRLKR